MTEPHPYYYPSGIPLGPQARKFGYDFPVHASKRVWNDQCVWTGMPSRFNTSTDIRIFALLQCCYEGMTKRLAVSDDFVHYKFKVWYWDRTRKTSKKKRRAQLGARLFLHPDTNTPWMYIFNMLEDTANELKEGNVPDDCSAGDDQAA